MKTSELTVSRAFVGAILANVLAGLLLMVLLDLWRERRRAASE